MRASSHASFLAFSAIPKRFTSNPLKINHSINLLASVSDNERRGELKNNQNDFTPKSKWNNTWLFLLVMLFLVLVSCLVVCLVWVNNKLQKNTVWLEKLLQSAPESLLVMDKDGNILDVNDSFETLLGYQRNELINRNFEFLLQSKKDIEKFIGGNEQVEAENNVAKYIAQIVKVLIKSSKFIDVEITCNLVSFKGSDYFIISMRDVTELKFQQEKIAYQANYDFLTDLPNRGYSLAILEQLKEVNLSAATEVAVIFLDLDDFKMINDTLGHDAGDCLLKQIANRLTENLRDGDVVGRLGGDEFIILAGGLTSPVQTHKVIENIQHAFERCFVIEGREILATTSIGISMFPSDGHESKELLRKSDAAMFHAKAANSLKYAFFIDNMNYKVSRQFIIEEAMQKAVGSKEFYVVYQPQVNLTTGRVRAVEALIRWNSSSLGNVCPDEFISVADCNGLIEPLGEMVLENAILMLSKWQHIIHDIELSINISARQLQNSEFIPFVEKLCRQQHVSFNSLVFELKEEVLLDDSATTAHKLKKLTDLGIKLSMDDFGTGYSSLNYLRKYAFSQLKLDKSLIKNINSDEDVRVLLNASIAMGNALAITVVAEGVETLPQKMMLQTMGCQRGQGYYYCKALSSEETTGYIRDQKIAVFSST